MSIFLSRKLLDILDAAATLRSGNLLYNRWDYLYGRSKENYMRIWIRTAATVVFAALAAWLTLSIPDTVQAQAPPAAKGKGKGFAQDPRAQTRMYHFEDTNEDLPYSIYVSSKVKKDKKAPLVVTLHGLGAPQTIMMGRTAVDLAEEAGYILVAPMGYNIGGWYGSPVGTGPGRGKGKGAPAPAPGTPPNAP